LNKNFDTLKILNGFIDINDIDIIDIYNWSGR